MPKNLKVVKTQSGNKKFKQSTKLRIGGRKSGVAAHSMSTADLQAVLSDNSKKRSWSKARKVLASRGVAA